MSLNKDRLRYLLQQYMADTISHEELFELSVYVKSIYIQDELHDLIDELWDDMSMESPVTVEGNVIYQRIVGDQRIQEDLSKPVIMMEVLSIIRLIQRYKIVAVAALFCIVIGSFWYIDINRGLLSTNAKLHLEVKQAPILPGGNKAMLTLADGRVIVLDEVKAGDLAEEAGMHIIKTADGKLIYKDTGSKSVKTAIAVLNTINTPVGGEYQLTLPDGTKVWLNAASSLRFPARFIGDMREVELIGEAYFEVSHQQSTIGRRIPFIVRTASQKVEVLGTHFNIKDYPNEDAAKTTLVEGSVSVSVRLDDGNLLRPANILKPNQQAVSELGSSSVRIINIDPINAVAWKNGYFSFHDDNIKDVMKTISRWYNIEVEYKGKTDDKIFGGTISRFETIEKLLQTIELTGTVKFKIEGRRVIVMT